MKMKEADKLDVKKAKLYLDGLAAYTEETGDNDWTLPFLENQLDFKTKMSARYHQAHITANAYVREHLNK